MRSAFVRLPECFVIRPAFAAGLCVLLLTACGQPAETGDAGDPYAGFDAQIPVWRSDIEATHPTCAVKVEGKGCEGFEVRCKGAQEVGPDDAAKGVTAQVISAMTFVARNPDGSTGKPGSAFALFSKADGQWTRTEAMPVNLKTCAPL